MECAGYATSSNEIFSFNNYPVIIEKKMEISVIREKKNACSMPNVMKKRSQQK
jgi:hypothetical protein